MKLDFTIDRLKRMALFARVVELGSMSAAARELDMTPSAVSQQLRQLEAETGVVLLHRSTRKLTTTEIGQAYYEDCAAMLHAARNADGRLGDLRDEPRGELRIAVPVGFASHLAPALAPLLRAYPALALRVFADDRQIDLIAERIDLAIRVGRLADSNLIARRMAEWRHLLVAAPEYAREHGLPRMPEELAQHPMLILSVMNQPEYVDMHRDGEPARLVRVGGRIVSNSSRTLMEMMLQGLGIVRLPEPDAAPLLADGRAVRVLPEWSMPPLGVFAVTAQRDAQPAKVRMAIAALQAYLQ
ncbi:Transcriptional regulator, LysR family [Lysobacter capsici AZ78]|uniref:Transcriptional regulator, LysR family n=1 Tax=Lysobacter capsici AZ78 TaxID=1444315 RepID=A0A125MNP3_9GAMM|nr:LysR family transcriptional regulator [Lysobacter capsici]KWS07176.1 Transcriptional regulator, LysR family [Lysobacter capsici AZ78]